MRKSTEKKIVRANALNEKSLTDGQLPYVVAAAKRDIDSKTLALASFECAECSTNFTAQANTKPHCFNCGSDKVETTAMSQGIGKLAPLQELTSVDCGQCSTHNIVADALLPKMKGTMHCVHCGEEMYFADNDQAVEESPALEDNIDITESEDLDEDLDDLDAGDSEVTDENQVEFSDSDEQEGVDDLEQTQETSEDTVDQQQDQQGEEQEQEAESDQDLTEDDFGGDNLGELDDTQTDDVMMNETDVQANVLKLTKITKSSTLDLVAHDKKIVAFVNDTPVAVLTEETAGPNKEVFYTEGFHKAILHTASTVGIRKSLAAYSFKPLAIKLNRTKLENATLTTQIAKEKAKYEEEIAKLRDSFVSSLSVASVGINKGFFKNKPNALKAALFDELSTLNIRTPSIVIDKVFAAYGDSYNKTLIETALELVGKPKEVFAALAESIGDTNFQTVKAEEVEADEDEEPDFDNMGNADEDLQQDSTVSSDSDSVKRVRSNVTSIREMTGSKTIFAKAL